MRIFSYAILHLHIFFGEVSVIAHFLIELFVFLLLSFKNSFCVLDTTLYLGDIFVQSMTFLFIPVTASSRSYIILSYTFRSIIHFMLIFMETVRSMSNMFFLDMDECLVVLYHHCSCVKKQLTTFVWTYDKYLSLLSIIS